MSLRSRAPRDQPITRKARGAHDPLGKALLDLARTGREEDFRWLARSRGMPEERITKQWSRIRAWLAAEIWSDPCLGGQGEAARRT